MFLPAVATVHDTLLPILEKGFAALHSSAEEQPPVSNENYGKQNGADLTAQDRLGRLSARLVELVWKLVELYYLEETTAKDSTTGSLSGKAYEEAVWKGDSLVQAIVSLGPSDNEGDSLGGELSSSVSRLVCTGALLRSVERFHGLSFHILQARQRGTVATFHPISGEIDSSKPRRPVFIILTPCCLHNSHCVLSSYILLRDK